MRITCIATGSRGDVQPYIALGVGFAKRGHDVVIATHLEFQSLVEGHGLQFYEIGGDPRSFLQGESGNQMLASGKNTLKFLTQFSKLLKPLLQHYVEEGIKIAQSCDALVLSNFGIINDRLPHPGVKYAAVFLQPFTPTKKFPSIFLPQLKWLPSFLAGFYNYFSHWLTLELFWRLFGTMIVKYHRIRGSDMKPAEKWGSIPLCYAFSPSIINRPDDWNKNIHVTGYLYLEQKDKWVPPAELVEFIQSGPTPIYVGFGSMTGSDPEGTAKTIIDALIKAQKRAVIYRGWNGLDSRENNPDIHFIDATPHDWLFPQMAAIIHHGGAGTTASALRAGVPQIIVPHMADQPFWANKMYELGVAAKPIPFSKLCVEKLSAAFDNIDQNVSIHKRARDLGQEIMGQNGVEQAVNILCRYFES